MVRAAVDSWVTGPGFCEPQNVEQGMSNFEGSMDSRSGRRTVSLTSAFIIPCSTFCGSNDQRSLNRTSDFDLRILDQSRLGLPASQPPQQRHRCDIENDPDRFVDQVIR